MTRPISPIALWVGDRVIAPTFAVWTVGVWGYLLCFHESNEFDPVFLGYPSEELSMAWIASIVILFCLPWVYFGCRVYDAVVELCNAAK